MKLFVHTRQQEILRPFPSRLSVHGLPYNLSLMNLVNCLLTFMKPLTQAALSHIDSGNQAKFRSRPNMNEFVAEAYSDEVAKWRKESASTRSQVTVASLRHSRAYCCVPPRIITSSSSLLIRGSTLLPSLSEPLPRFWRRDECHPCSKSPSGADLGFGAARRSSHWRSPHGSFVERRSRCKKPAVVRGRGKFCEKMHKIETSFGAFVNGRPFFFTCIPCYHASNVWRLPTFRYAKYDI